METELLIPLENWCHFVYISLDNLWHFHICPPILYQSYDVPIEIWKSSANYLAINFLFVNVWCRLIQILPFIAQCPKECTQCWQHLFLALVSCWLPISSCKIIVYFPGNFFFYIVCMYIIIRMDSVEIYAMGDHMISMHVYSRLNRSHKKCMW